MQLSDMIKQSSLQKQAFGGGDIMSALKQLLSGSGAKGALAGGAGGAGVGAIAGGDMGDIGLGALLGGAGGASVPGLAKLLNVAKLKHGAKGLAGTIDENALAFRQAAKDKNIGNFAATRGASDPLVKWQEGMKGMEDIL